MGGVTVYLLTQEHNSKKFGALTFKQQTINKTNQNQI